MPRISEFYGIAIYYEDHGPPHFHALHGPASRSIQISS